MHDNDPHRHTTKIILDHIASRETAIGKEIAALDLKLNAIVFCLLKLGVLDRLSFAKELEQFCTPLQSQNENIWLDKLSGLHKMAVEFDGAFPDWQALMGSATSFL